MIGLLEIVADGPRRAGRGGGGSTQVIVDTAPTGHTLRLLAAPALLGRVAGVLDNLQSHHRAVVAALRGSYRADAADTLIGELERDGEALAAMLRDPAASEVTWVTLPEPMALEETSDALAHSIAAAGIPVRRLIAEPRDASPPPATRRSGAVSPKARSDEVGCEWCAARRRFEARALAPVARRFAISSCSRCPSSRKSRAASPRCARLRRAEPWKPPVAARPLVIVSAL